MLGVDSFDSMAISESNHSAWAVVALIYHSGGMSKSYLLFLWKRFFCLEFLMYGSFQLTGLSGMQSSSVQRYPDVKRLRLESISMHCIYV